MQHKIKEKKIKPYKKKKVKKEKNLLDNQKDLLSLLAPEVIQEKRDYIYLGDNNYLKVNKSDYLVKDNKENFKTYTCDEFKKEFRRVQ